MAQNGKSVNVPEPLPVVIPRDRKSYMRLATKPTHPSAGTTSRTQDSHADQTNVNDIVARFARTGEMPVGKGTPQYGDVTSLQGDLTEQINQANEDIAALNAYKTDLEALAAAKALEPPEPEPTPEPTPTPTATP